jgi:hypothetical protein
MALKDHTIDSSKISEEQIEAIIADRIKYDLANQSVVLLPAARSLTNEKRILLYLTALQGWRFIVENEAPEENATPTQITQATGIPGGSVRPLLRGLENRKILVATKGKYGVPPHCLALVQTFLATETALEPKEKSLQVSGKAGKGKATKRNAGRRAKNSSKKPTLAEGFEALIEKKWFAEGKTINQLKEELDDMTVFPPLEQLPWHLLRAFRAGRLQRERVLRDGKKIYVYSQE